ncbi:regulatory protein TetR [Agrobacterium tumefaciens CCNWGS0286]|uniref:TetR/AcrR family transcriptional regulator n=1 Tax=Agrobacterium tumefaciens TaxID=358 RepID=UPI00023346AE|nr:TetR/AcrR family transcriptional regulator [Agrobacterium tumefaciens]EHH02589.1 regulatory protein TetR [Agrobacterium tumefaciens CCNWGS0286]
MRADALKNRQRLIEATVALVLEAGGEPARDAIAGRAGVGIGTLYRHFPDQQALLHAAARHVLDKSISAGEELVETVPDGVDALRQYMHAALDNGIGAVNIIRPLLQKPDWPDLRTRAGALMKKLVEGAARRGALRDDLSERDIVFALTRFARPLAMGLPAVEERALAHRHLDFYINGLCLGPQIAPPQPLE